MSSADQLSRLLAVERAASPPSGTSEAELQRLLGSLAAHAAPLPVATGSLKLGWLLGAKWIGAGFALGMAAAGLASFVAPSGSEAGATPVPVEGRSVLGPARVPSPSPEVVRPATSGLPAPASPKGLQRVAAVSAAAVASVPSALPSVQPGLDEELRLITAAKRELDQGRPHLARVWLDEHRQRFPDGVFGVEREGLSVLAVCSGAQNPSLARDFASRYPQSPMLAQVWRRCGSEESSGAATPTSSDSFTGNK